MCRAMALLRWRFVLVVYLFLDAASAMFNKRSKGYDASDMSPSKRLRCNLADLFLSNTLPGDRTQSLFDDAAAASARGGFENLQSRSDIDKNAHRNVLRKLLKGCKWPPPYLVKVRIWNNTTQKPDTCWVPVLLPHEVLHAIMLRSNKQAMFDKDGMSATARRHLEQVAGLIGTDLLGVGLWLDGTPCNWDRSQSVETIALNLPGLTGDVGKLRIPLAALMKRDHLKHHTVDDLLAVMSWSMQNAIAGRFPTHRHDGTPFHAKSDRFRQGKANADLSVRALLVEVRADWAALKQAFRFPGWRDSSGCCFRCDIVPGELRNVSAESTWRQPHRRMSHWKLMQRILAKGHGISTLFSMPYFTAELVAIDWLHCCDLGVACDLLGNLFWMLLPHMNGGNQQDRLADLYMRIRAFYGVHKSESRLDTLTVLMIRKKASTCPKLRAKAGEARALVPFAREIAEQVLGDHGVEGAAKQMARHLDECYKCLSKPQFDRTTLELHSRRFCQQYVAIESASPPPYWRLKPKHHLFLELCSEGVCPSTCWTYRDEDFGGSVAQLARRRGGGNAAKICGWLVLNKFRAKHSVPAML